jgi:hypothetical protein
MFAVHLYDVSNKLYASPVALKLLAAPGVDDKPVVIPCVLRRFISIAYSIMAMLVTSNIASFDSILNDQLKKTW